jgi:uncharacterized protein
MRPCNKTGGAGPPSWLYLHHVPLGRPAAIPPIAPILITDPLFYLVAIVAVTTLGLSKGGFAGIGLIATPLLSLVVPPLQAIGILIPILIVQDVVSVWTYRKAWSGRILAVMIPGQAIGTALAWLAAAHVHDAYVRLAIGIISLAFTLNHWFGKRPPETDAPPSTTSGVFWGGLAGFTSFLANSGAPPFQVHVLPLRLDKLTYVGTLTLFFAVGNILKVVPFFFLGQLNTPNLATSLTLLPLAIATNLAGVWLVRRTPTELFYRIAYVLVFLVSLELIRNGIMGIIGG